MSKQILEKLENKLKELSSYGNLDTEVRINTLKEELQYYVLNFIYHHPKYSKWVMYGGSALRIIHGLDRMSVDLDFEVDFKIDKKFLEEFKKEIEDYFADEYNTEEDFLQVKIQNNRGLLLKFIDKKLTEGYPSNQIHLKIDLNEFTALKIVTERRPINHDQLSFIILTYNMSALMASKIAAIFLRGTRIVGGDVFEEKGRDIYDLLWYMNKKIIPDFDYLVAKGIDITDPRALFDKITLETLNKEGTDKNLKNDLIPLFADRGYIDNWLINWRKSFMGYLKDYKIGTIKKIDKIRIHQDFSTDIFHFAFWYKTEEGDDFRIIYNLSDYWIDFREGKLSTESKKSIEEKIEFSRGGSSSQKMPVEDLKKYATLFFKKNMSYFKKTNKIVLGDVINTKLIRITADNLNPKEQIILTKSALDSCELDDLLK